MHAPPTFWRCSGPSLNRKPMGMALLTTRAPASTIGKGSEAERARDTRGETDTGRERVLVEKSGSVFDGEDRIEGQKREKIYQVEQSVDEEALRDGKG